MLPRTSLWPAGACQFRDWLTADLGRGLMGADENRRSLNGAVVSVREPVHDETPFAGPVLLRAGG
jgi:hypothetical protein